MFYNVLCFSLKWFDQSNFHFHRGRTWRLSVLKQENFTCPMDVWNMLTIWSAVSFILVVLFRSRTCDNALENHGRNEERTFFILQRNLQRSNIFQPSNIFQDSTSSDALHMTLLHPPHPPSVNNNGTCNVATSSNQATSSRIQHHPTHFTWRYYTPPTPPICIQERPFWYSIKTEGSSKLRGTPSLEPIYIHTL